VLQIVDDDGATALRRQEAYGDRLSSACGPDRRRPWALIYVGIDAELPTIRPTLVVGAILIRKEQQEHAK
jgi:hypothetical protein